MGSDVDVTILMHLVFWKCKYCCHLYETLHLLHLPKAALLYIVHEGEAVFKIM